MEMFLFETSDGRVKLVRKDVEIMHPFVDFSNLLQTIKL